MFCYFTSLPTPFPHPESFNVLVNLETMSERLPPFFRLTENDQGGVAAVVALCTIVITSSISAIRWLVASRQHVEFQRDDATFYLGSVRPLLTSLPQVHID